MSNSQLLNLLRLHLLLETDQLSLSKWGTFKCSNESSCRLQLFSVNRVGYLHFPHLILELYTLLIKHFSYLVRFSISWNVIYVNLVHSFITSIYNFVYWDILFSLHFKFILYLMNWPMAYKIRILNYFKHILIMKLKVLSFTIIRTKTNSCVDMTRRQSGCGSCGRRICPPHPLRLW